MRRALALVVANASIAVGVAGAAPRDKKKPDEPPPPPAAPRTPGPDDAKALELLKGVEAGKQPGKDALAALAALDAPDAIGEFLHREHAVSTEDRRKALLAVKAVVPNKDGRFPQRDRDSAKEQAEDEAFDWLAKLPADAPGELVADDVAIRALAAEKDLHAAQVIFDAAFWPETMIYRDECGRYLRRMEPWSIPALTVESQTGKDFDRRRYATFQLERMDRQEPGKALSATAGNEGLTIGVLDAFLKIHHREAVHAVWSMVNADSPRVRAAARATWMGYVVGPPPPPAPMAKLNLPGGKKTKKPKPLYLTYRELADNELRKSANELLHEDYPLADPSIDDNEHDAKSVKVDVEDLTKRLFAFYDEQRAKSEAAQWGEAKALADKGDLAGATAQLDRMLASNGERPEQAAMAQVYFRWAKALEAKQAWGDASAAYSKAYGLDPKGPQGNEALAAHHFTLGKQLETAGKDGGPDFRKAIAIMPTYGTAMKAAADAGAVEGATKRPIWMLYASVVAAAIAIALFGVAMLRRRG